MNKAPGLGEIFCIMLFCMFWFAVLGYAMGYSIGKKDSNAEAISAGVGEYYLDKDAVKQFRYKKN